MKMTYETTVSIRTDLDAVWQTVCGPEFERDLLPEVSREQVGSSQQPSTTPGEQITWRNGVGMSIQMRRKDLNVHIESVQIALRAHRDQVRVTLRVAYRKPFEKHFLKARCAVRHLFGYKLEVLKRDLERHETKQTSTRSPLNRHYLGRSRVLWTPVATDTSLH